MKKSPAVAVFLALLLLALPLLAQEQLMTKHYFDNWLITATSPLEERIKALQASFAQMQRDVKEMRSRLMTEIRIVIGQASASIDGRPVGLDVAPVIVNGRTMVPLRFVGEAFGALFSWDEKSRRVTCSLDDTTIELFIDRKTALANGKNVSLDAAPFIAGGRTMVPLRFIGEHMGASLEWDPESKTAAVFR
ncbi:MAG: copper amine oxidase N-terminal domain-containing protein [Peptococcaceae bacterium]|jgi:hypothetical protein|nr:copper amine oxidase N-terminal domain-containing protein [Peptococcaceae bacterium]